MTKVKKSWFFDVPEGENYDRFKKENKPSEDTFRNLTDSILFSTEPADSASETQAGHGKIAKANDVGLKNENDNEGFTLFITPKNLHNLTSKTLASGEDFDIGTNISYFEQSFANGIRVDELKLIKNGIYKLYHRIRLLCDFNYFDIKNNGDLTISESFKMLIDSLSTLTKSTSTGLEIKIPTDKLDENTFEPYFRYENNKLGIRLGDEFEIGNDAFRLKYDSVDISKFSSRYRNSILVTDEDGKVKEIPLNVNNAVLTFNNGVLRVLTIKEALGDDILSEGSVKAINISDEALGNGIAKLNGKLIIRLGINSSLIFDEEGNIMLNGDSNNPGVNKYYGTDSEGVKGFHSIETSNTIDTRKHVKKVMDISELSNYMTFTNDDIKVDEGYYLVPSSIKVTAYGLYVHTENTRYLPIPTTMLSTVENPPDTLQYNIIVTLPDEECQITINGFNNISSYGFNKFLVRVDYEISKERETL